MGFWLRVDDELNEQITLSNVLSRNKVKRSFSLGLGCEPMEANMFQYCIAEIIKTMHGGMGDYISVHYVPVREDCVSCIQATRPWNTEGITVEIIKVLNDGLNFHTYALSELSVSDVIDIFNQVLVYYECPDLDDWDEITDVVMDEIKVHNPER